MFVPIIQEIRLIYYKYEWLFFCGAIEMSWLKLEYIGSARRYASMLKILRKWNLTIGRVSDNNKGLFFINVAQI